MCVYVLLYVKTLLLYVFCAFCVFLYLFLLCGNLTFDKVLSLFVVFFVSRNQHFKMCAMQVGEESLTGSKRPF